MKFQTDWGNVDIDPFKVTRFNVSFDVLNNTYQLELFFETSRIVATLNEFDGTISKMKELYHAIQNSKLGIIEGKP